MEPTKKELKEKAFEYMMYKMALWYIEIYHLELSGRHYNSFNYFEKDQVLLFPFIVCMASTDRKKMLACFDAFFADQTMNGIIERDLCDYSFGEDFRLLAIPEMLPWASKDTIVLEFERGKRQVPLSKENFCMEGVPYEEIDTAINHLREKNARFVRHDIEKISAYNRGHLCWLLYNKEGMNIPVEKIEKERSIFSPEPSKLLLV